VNVLEVVWQQQYSLLLTSLTYYAARFGFNQASSIDSLLDKDDVALEALLDEDDLLQECKAQNTRLIEYFGRGDVLKKLLGYVTGETESEEKGRFKCVSRALLAFV
jgi:serine/threonine-protein phosphatase 6 regulatory subunit 3